MTDLYLNFYSFAYSLIHFISYIPYLGAITILSLIFFTYKKLPVFLHLSIIAIYLSQCNFSPIFWSMYLIGSLLLTIPLLRRNIITLPIILLINKAGLLPKISETEKIALTSGSIWVDGQLFSGKPDFKWIFSQKYPKLRSDEKSF